MPLARHLLARTRLRSMRLSHAAIWGGLLLAVAVVVLAGAEAWLTRERQFQQETIQSRLIASVLDEQATRSLNTLGVVLTSLSEPLMAGTRNMPQVREAMVQALASLPFVRSIALADNEGKVLASTNAADENQRLDLKALPMPRGLHDGGLGEWMPGRSLPKIGVQGITPPGVGGIPYVVQVAGHEKMFVAFLNPEALLGFHALMQRTRGRIAMLVTYDGAVLAAQAGVDATAAPRPGERITGHPAFAMRTDNRYQAVLRGMGVSGPAVIAFEGSSGQPVMLVVERDEASVTQEWLSDLSPLLVIVAVGLFAVLAMTLVARHSLRAQEADQWRLAEQLELNLLILETNPVPMSLLDNQGRFVRVNKAWEDFMSRKRDEIIGTPARQLLGDPADTAAAALSPAEDGSTRWEATLRRGDGMLRDVVISQVPVLRQDGPATLLVCTLLDVSEFRQAERTTQEARDAAEQSLRTRSEFIANISHELRTPLQSILGFSELGAQRGGRPERVQAMFAQVHEAGEHMLALVNDLLDVSKLDSTVGAVTLETTEITGLVERVARQLTPLLAPKALHFQLELPQPPLHAEVDPMRFDQVLRNVIANAIKFCREAGMITVAASVVGEHLHVQVTDQGPGVPEAELESIFEAFVQSTRTKSGAGGTGLGLAICRKIMQAHGGDIHAENAEGGGTRIHIRVPLQPTAAIVRAPRLADAQQA